MPKQSAASRGKAGVTAARAELLARRDEFARGFTEKLLTYALGRGLEYYDAETVDQIVQRLDREDGRFGALLTGIIESAPFQKMRTQATAATPNDSKPSADPKTAKRVASNQTKP